MGEIAPWRHTYLHGYTAAGPFLVPNIPPTRRADRGSEGWCVHVNPLSSGPTSSRGPCNPPTRPSSAIRGQPLHLDIGSARARFLLALAPQQPLGTSFESNIRRGLVDAASADREHLGLRPMLLSVCNANCEPPGLASPLCARPSCKRVTIQFPDPGSSGTPRARVLHTRLSPCIKPAPRPGRRAVSCRAMFAAVIEPMVALQRKPAAPSISPELPTALAERPNPRRWPASGSNVLTAKANPVLPFSTSAQRQRCDLLPGWRRLPVRPPIIAPSRCVRPHPAPSRSDYPNPLMPAQPLRPDPIPPPSCADPRAGSLVCCGSRQGLLADAPTGLLSRQPAASRGWVLCILMGRPCVLLTRAGPWPAVLASAALDALGAADRQRGRIGPISGWFCCCCWGWRCWPQALAGSTAAPPRAC